MSEFPNWSRIYVIYSADVVSDRESYMESMSPAVHVPAGRAPDAQLDRIVTAFTQTEGDEQYDYGYLADEGASPRLRAYADRENDESPNAGRHRKWVGELSREDWRVFADSYCIDLDASTDLPVDYEETLGAITEYGHLEAIAVDVHEGWDDYSGSQAIDATMYLSFAREETTE